MYYVLHCVQCRTVSMDEHTINTNACIPLRLASTIYCIQSPMTIHNTVVRAN